MNKYQEAKKYINKIIENPKWSKVDIEWQAIDEIKELLDKATPMKPKNINVENLVENGFIPLLVAECSKCECEIVEHQDYCWHCGQAIDWGKDNV